MNDSFLSWSAVWENSDSIDQYSFKQRRFERALDKLDHFNIVGAKFSPGEKVLEAGCGDGAVIIALQKQYRVNGYGADFAASAELQARHMMGVQNSKFKFTLADICNLPYPDQYFDKVVCLGVIEHMADPVAPLRELRRVLKRDGVAIIMTPNSFSAGRLDRVIKQIFGFWSMGYQDEFSPSALAGLLSKAGFRSLHNAAVHRPALPNDSWSRRLVSCIDYCVRKVVKGWGFYSYVWMKE